MKKIMLTLGLIVLIAATTIYATNRPKPVVKSNKTIAPTALSYYWFYPDNTWSGMYNTYDFMVLITGYDSSPAGASTLQYKGYAQWNVYQDQYGALHPLPPAYPDKVLYSHP